MTADPCLVVAVVGLSAEAGIARGEGVTTVAGGGDAARLTLMLQGVLARGASAVISFGIAGGLSPALASGAVVLGRAVLAGGTRFAADEAWLARLASRLPHAVVGDIAGVDTVVQGAAGKRSLHEATGALAVDMESHVAARLAAQHGVPFAALRIVADPADRSLPYAATIGMRPDGRMDARRVLAALARRPGDIPGLIRTALDAGTALMTLRRDRRRLGDRLGFDVTGPVEVPPRQADTPDMEVDAEPA